MQVGTANGSVSEEIEVLVRASVGSNSNECSFTEGPSFTSTCVLRRLVGDGFVSVVTVCFPVINVVMLSTLLVLLGLMLRRSLTNFMLVFTSVPTTDDLDEFSCKKRTNIVGRPQDWASRGVVGRCRAGIRLPLALSNQLLWRLCLEFQ